MDGNKDKRANKQQTLTTNHKTQNRSILQLLCLWLSFFSPGGICPSPGQHPFLPYSQLSLAHNTRANRHWTTLQEENSHKKLTSQQSLGRHTRFLHVQTSAAQLLCQHSASGPKTSASFVSRFLLSFSPSLCPCFWI